MSNQNLTIFQGLSQYPDKLEILTAIITQLEKDTGLDYTQTPIDADSPEFLNALRSDLANHLKKIAGQNHTRFMHLIYRVDITQTKLNRLEMDINYFHNLAELVLNRMFQKTITKRFLKG
jgi:hypothetical protein